MYMYVYSVTIGVGMILKLGGGGRLSHGEHVHSDTSLINSHFKDYLCTQIFNNPQNKDSC